MKQARLLTAHEFKRVLQIIDAHRHSERNRAVFHLSFLAGLRACEVCSLRISDVCDEDYRVKTQIVLTADMTKGSERNRVILSTALQKALQRYISAVCASKPRFLPLIQSQKGGAFSPNTLVQLFSKFYAKAGVEGASSHSGRRQFVTALAENGIHVKLIQALARHRHVNTTLRYISINDAKLANAVEVVSV